MRHLTRITTRTIPPKKPTVRPTPRAVELVEERDASDDILGLGEVEVRAVWWSLVVRVAE